MDIKTLKNCDVVIPRVDDDSTQSKNHIPKVMFLIAVGLPQTSNETGKTFSGKVGIWPIVKEVPARRSSKNRCKGTIEKRPLAMRGPEYARFLTQPNNGLFDLLKASGDLCGIDNCVVQQDGAKPHISKHIVPQIAAEGKRDGKNIVVETQPPQSPDLNVLDLAFNSSIQSVAKRIKYSVKSVEDFIDQVTEVFRSYPSDKLLRICALQLVAYREILQNLGGNQYDMPHTHIRLRQKNNFEKNGNIYEDLLWRL